MVGFIASARVPAAVLAALAIAASGCLVNPPEAGNVREGSGFVKLMGDRNWKEAEEGSVIYENDFVATGDGMLLHLKVGLSGIVMDENSSLFVGGIDDRGMRRVCLERGDMFFSVSRTAANPLLVETHAGRIALKSGLILVRLVDKKADDGEDYDTPTRPSGMEMNVVVVSGEAIIENCGMGRRIREGFLCYAETGGPPAEPVEVDKEALDETRAWIRKQTGGSEFAGPMKPRKNVFVPKSEKPSEGGKAGGG